MKIFFTRVFRDGFFHADMHPGNIFVLKTALFGVDFGIMGTLTDADATTSRATSGVFDRDYKRRGGGAHRGRLGAEGHAGR